MVRNPDLVDYNAIDETCSSRRQGIDDWHTTGTRYIKSE